MPKALVLGAGSWGTALAAQLSKCGSDVTLWARREIIAQDIRLNARNTAYLGDIELPAMMPTTDLGDISSQQYDVVVSAVPSAYSAQMWSFLCEKNFSPPYVVSATKGLVQNGQHVNRFCTEVLCEFFPQAGIGVLSGPSFAAEVASSTVSSPHPTAVVIAGLGPVTDISVQLFSSPYFRVYTSSDVIGVQVGGIVKNIIAIAAGISDGLSFGANARAALITRGLAEMARFAASMGGLEKSSYGLSGMGDLMLTCSDDQSRNRRVGLAIAKLYHEGATVWASTPASRKGKDGAYGDINPLKAWLREHLFIPEGVVNCRHILELASRQNIRMPIVETVEAILSCTLSPSDAVLKLLASQAGREYTEL